MRLVFLGTPEYAVPVLEALLGAGHQVVEVLTQPDKEAGRGRVPTPPPVKAFAQGRGLPVFQPPTLRRPEVVEHLRALAPEALVAAAYGRYVPREVLSLPPLGCLNLHPSLLPRHRGPSPVATALLEGDERTGVTVFLMDEGLDTGPILAQEEEPVLPTDTTEILTRRLFQKGARLMVDTLERWARGEVRPVPQDHSRATTTRLLKKEDGALDFREPAVLLERKIRAFQPWPGAYTFWRGRLLKLLEAVVLPPWPGEVGEVVALPPGEGAPVGVITGEGVLGLRRLHLEGKRPLPAQEFLRGYRDFPGSRLPG